MTRASFKPSLVPVMSADRKREKPVSCSLQRLPDGGRQYSDQGEEDQRHFPGDVNRRDSSDSGSDRKRVDEPIEREQSVVERLSIEMTEESFCSESYVDTRPHHRLMDERGHSAEDVVELSYRESRSSINKRVDEPIQTEHIDTDGFSIEMTQEIFFDEPYEVSSEVVSIPDDCPRDADELNRFWQRTAKSMARRPKTYFWSAFLAALTIAFVGLYFGNFSVEPDNRGWNSRGTLIADRNTQAFLVDVNRFDLFTRDEVVWDNLINIVQPGWETNDDEGSRRLLIDSVSPSVATSSWLQTIAPMQSLLPEQPKVEGLPFPLEVTDALNRRLLNASTISLLEGCDLSRYDATGLTKEGRLWSVWKTQKSSDSALDPHLLRDLCLSEEKTQAHLERERLCITCKGGGCLPPYGLVLFARLTVADGFTMTCDQLAEAWPEYQSSTELQMAKCIQDLKLSFDPNAPIEKLPASCPFGFYPTLVDKLFDSTMRVEYSASIFSTIQNPDALFEKVSGYDRGTELIKGAYDTRYGNFAFLQTEVSLYNDMLLAAGSALITALAILVHTRSPFLTLVGLLQIILSIPTAYFFYVFVARLEFFPVLNYIGIFVVFALGADDVFVAVDKWKNARLAHWDKSTEYVAAKALPDAAGAMFLTTLTTAVAFFGTAVCPVAPVLCFAVYCGILVIMDYVLCLVLVFPALCICDEKKDVRNICFNCHVCRQLEAKGPHGEEDDERPSLIRRILLVFYKFIHRFRWILLAGCLAGFGVSAYFASKLGFPESSDVRLLRPETFQYELNYEWRFNLLFDVFLRQSGSQTYLLFGTKAADTGNHLDPRTLSQLVLDETFDPSGEEVQIYLRGFCDDLFAQDFAEKPNPDYVCPMNAFDAWLQQQSQLDLPDDDYLEFCGGATGLPVRQSNFNACMIAWSQQSWFKPILARGDVVEIMYVEFNSKVRYDSPYEDIKREWLLTEKWMKNQAKNVAPEGIGEFYTSSFAFWWYDTNNEMLSTTYVAAAIALVTAGVVILFSSHSVTLTLFAVFTIGFILAATTACLVGLGWSLGFVESICFAILIGISCDFVIHFAHAYATLPGMHSRDERTKHALILMGPSILAAAFTTIAAAIIMLFTVITFFEKFASILFLTVLLATVGSFVVFLTLADSIGPTHPTFLVDLMMNKFSRRCKGCRTKSSFSAATTEDSSSSQEDDDASQCTIENRVNPQIRIQNELYR